MAEVEVDNEKQVGLCKKVLRMSFSHIGLCIIVILYCVLGGFLFELLEKENEIQSCVDARKEYDDMENETLFSLLDVVLKNPLESEAGDAQLRGVFESFRNNSFSVGYSGEWCEGFGHPNGPTHEWTFAGGLFFSMTVITTIGYGHIAPKTIWGRILCVSYALMGIPLMLMFLANIGDILADVFRYVYAVIICCGCLKRKKKKKRRVRRTAPIDSNTAAVNKAFVPDREPTSASNIAKRKESAMKTRPGTAMTREPTFAPPACLSTEASLMEHSEPPDGTQYHSRSSSELSFTSSEKSKVQASNPLNIQPLGNVQLSERGKLLRQSSTAPLVLDDVSDDDDEEWEKISKVAVPLTVSLGIIGLYMIGGAVLFKYWEEWDMLQSSYFCFITLSTIGFGDVTPGRDFTDPTANARLIIGTVYSIFGMAILSMCFTLMQEEMVSKFVWIGRKFGVVETEEEENERLALEATGQNTSQSDC